uniref:Uncharacterized protein LOC111134697 isoform X2 n=1 Tax=Crassostrea virginica TaxID=6565 RepID=A0A8B8EIZ4_CRAVI|nr:uncharacterized protein LOC111134697 isoform X2 [Crassostrea virginica]
MGDRYCFSHGEMENEYCCRRSFRDEMPSHCENSNCDIPRQHGDYLMVPSGQPIDHQHRSRSPQLSHHRRHWQSRSPDLHHHTEHWQTPVGDRSTQSQVNHASPSACDRTRPYEVTHVSPSACFRTRPSEITQASPSACNRTRPSEVNHASPSACFRTRPSEVTHASPSACNRTRPSEFTHASLSACNRPRLSEVTHASPSACFRTRQAEVTHARPSDTAFTCQQGFSEFVRLHKLKKGQEQILERESVEVEGCAQSEESSETLATVSNQGVRGSRILMPRNLGSSQVCSPCSLTTGANELSNMARPPPEVTAPDLPNHIQLSKRVKNCLEGPQMYRDRKATLESMPFSLPLSPDILAAAGFYYEVDCQRVMCFSCGGFLQTSASDTRTTDAGHSPGCKHVSSPQQTLEPSSQPASLTDTEIASLPMVQEITQYSFDVPDIVNAYRELNNTLDIRDVTRDKVLMYMFENQGREDFHDNSEPCLCCVCCRASICVMCFPCRHGCCHDCKLRLLNRCLKCDEIIKATINVYVS